MIQKKLITTLLLVVSFSNSYSIDNIVNDIINSNLDNYKEDTNNIRETTINQSFEELIKPNLNELTDTIIQKTKISHDSFKYDIYFNPEHVTFNISIDFFCEDTNIEVLAELITPIIQQMNHYDIPMYRVAKNGKGKYTIYIKFSFQEKYIARIYNNITGNKNFNTNVTEFFNNYIGNNGENISNIFNIENDQILNNIKLILQNSQVKDYILNKLIKEEFEMKIVTNRKTLFKGINDPSKDKVYPASMKEFKLQYLSHFVNELPNEEWLPNSQVNGAFNNIIKKNTKSIINKYINDMKRYIYGNILDKNDAQVKDKIEKCIYDMEHYITLNQMDELEKLFNKEVDSNEIKKNINNILKCYMYGNKSINSRSIDEAARAINEAVANTIQENIMTKIDDIVNTIIQEEIKVRIYIEYFSKLKQMGGLKREPVDFNKLKENIINILKYYMYVKSKSIDEAIGVVNEIVTNTSKNSKEIRKEIDNIANAIIRKNILNKIDNDNINEALNYRAKDTIIFINNIKKDINKNFTNTIQEDINHILREYIHDMKQYIDNRKEEIMNKSTINKAYEEYLNCYKDGSNINEN